MAVGGRSLSTVEAVSTDLSRAGRALGDRSPYGRAARGRVAAPGANAKAATAQPDQADLGRAADRRPGPTAGDRPDLAARADRRLPFPPRSPIRPLCDLPPRHRSNRAGPARLAGISTRANRDPSADHVRGTGRVVIRRRLRPGVRPTGNAQAARGYRLAHRTAIAGGRRPVACRRCDPTDRRLQAGQSRGGRAIPYGGSHVRRADRTASASRTAAPAGLASAARPVCRIAEPASEIAVRLHRLSCRAGQCHRIPMGLAHPQRSRAACRMARAVRLVAQRALALSHAAATLRPERLPTMPPRRDRPGAKPPLSRPAGPEAVGRLPSGSPTRLFRVSRDQRPRRVGAIRRPGHAAGA